LGKEEKRQFSNYWGKDMTRKRPKLAIWKNEKTKGKKRERQFGFEGAS